METNNKLVDNKEEGDDKEVDEELDWVCKHCNTDPCWSRELESTFQSIMENYGGRMPNSGVRYKMYTQAVQVIFGICLGKGVRKRVPLCVTRVIRSMAPDDVYTGFLESSKKQINQHTNDNNDYSRNKFISFSIYSSLLFFLIRKFE